MPVLEATDSLTPRSALRHHHIEVDSAATGITPVVQRTSRLRPRCTEENEEGAWKPRADDGDAARSGRASTALGPSSTPTRNPPKTPRMTRMSVKRRGILRGRLLLYLLIGMISHARSGGGDHRCGQLGHDNAR